METAITITLYIHLIGMAGLLGGSLAQIKSQVKQTTPLMLHSGLTQLVTGLLLVGLLQANDETMNMAIVGAKLGILAAILILLFLGRKKMSIKAYSVVVFLILVNVGLALFVESEVPVVVPA